MDSNIVIRDIREISLGIPNTIPNLGGFVVVRNGIELDYSFELAIASLLEVCSEVIVCDSDSTDGTIGILERWAEREPRIKLVNFPWTNPKGKSHFWFCEWLNFARQQLTLPHYVYIDADEVLDTTLESRQALSEAVLGRKSLRVDRLNFFRDPKHLIPDGECCGKWCVRVGPVAWECVSDQPCSAGEFPVVDAALPEPRIKIYHLGFLREKHAFYRKSRVVLSMWFNRFDERLEDGEKADKPIHETNMGEWVNNLVPYTGYLPPAVAKWLEDRGHDTLP